MKKIKFTTTGDNGKTTISLNYRDMGVKFSAHTRVRLVGKSWIEIKISGFSDIPNIFMTEDQFREYKDHEYYSEISDFLEEAKEKHAKIALFYQMKGLRIAMEMERELKLHPLFPKAEVTDVSRTSCDNFDHPTDPESMECHNTMKRKMKPNQCESIPKTENNSSSEKEVFLTTEQPDEKIVKELPRLRPVFKSTETLNSGCPESEPNGEHAKVQTVRDFIPGKVYVFEVHFDDIGFDKVIDIAYDIINKSFLIETPPHIFFCNEYDLLHFKDDPHYNKYKIQKLFSNPNVLSIMTYVGFLDTDQIREQISRFRESTNEKPVRIFIDDLHTTCLPNKPLCKLQEAMKELKEIAVRYNVAIIVRQQVPRSVEPKVVVDTAYWLEDPRNEGDE